MNPKPSRSSQVPNGVTKRAPADRRFGRGQKINTKGRPKGSRNHADIVKKILNEKVSGHGREITLLEYIIRQQVLLTQQGDKRARKNVAWIVDKFIPADVTSEEREKRTIRLPGTTKPWDHYDLKNADGREWERQRISAVVDRPKRAKDPKLTQAPIVAGDKLVAESKFDEAITCFCRQLDECDATLSVSSQDTQARELRELALGRIGLLADHLLLAGKFELARKYAGIALDRANEAKATTVQWISIIGAHADMFLGNFEKARSTYLSFNTDTHEVWTSFEMAILQDFVRLRAAKLSSPLMAEIEKKLSDGGWTAKGARRESPQVAWLSSDDRYSMIINPHTVETAALQVKEGKLDDAKSTYERILDDCQATLKKAPANVQAKDNLPQALAGLSALAEKFMAEKRYPSAIECAEKVLASAPQQLRMHAIKGHALALLGRDEEAERCYLQYRGRKFGDVLWEDMILADFKTLTMPEQAKQLVDKIESVFAGRPQLPGTTVALNLVGLSDPQKAERLLEARRTDEAVAVCVGRLKICADKLINGRVNMQALEDRQIMVDYLSWAAEQYIENGALQKALDATDRALAAIPNAASPQSPRAQALKLLAGQEKEH